METILTCPDCLRPLEWTYAFGLVAIDSTGRMPLLCYGKDAEQFLGISAVNFGEDGKSRQKIKHILSRILSDISDPSGPCLDICLRSYPKKSDHLIIRYCIFESNVTK